MRKKSTIALASYDDMFRDEAVDGGEKVEKINLSQLSEFPEHPYSVRDDEELAMLTDSILENGVLQPIVVYEKEDRSGYLIISGHRRCMAARKAGLSEIPSIVRKGISMAQATIEMVDANLYREHILPSEKAKAYRLRMEALKQEPNKIKGAGNRGEIIADQVGESRAMVHRYLRLNYLVPELLAQVDNTTISLIAGNSLSFLKNEKQLEVAKYMRPSGISMEQADQLRKAAEKQLWDKKIVKHILRDKPSKGREQDPYEEDPEEVIDNTRSRFFPFRHTVFCFTREMWKRTSTRTFCSSRTVSSKSSARHPRDGVSSSAAMSVTNCLYRHRSIRR